MKIKIIMNIENNYYCWYFEQWLNTILTNRKTNKH